MNEAKIAEMNALVRKNSRNELIRLCKEKSLSYSGTKHDMALRLIGGLHEDEPPIQHHIRKIVIHRNQNGQWEFEGLIFDNNTKNVIGKLANDGKSIVSLQRIDIEKCRQYKFRYNMPEVLDERHDTCKHFDHDNNSSDEEEEEDEQDQED